MNILINFKLVLQFNWRFIKNDKSIDLPEEYMFIDSGEIFDVLGINKNRVSFINNIIDPEIIEKL